MSGGWDESVDFLVVGSGAAGMTGALVAHERGARTLVIEKSAFYGGNTALSGGALWVPDNHLMREQGIDDSREEGLRYLETVTAGSSSSERLRRYVETAPEMVRFLDEHSHVHFDNVPEYPDYFPEAEGGKAGGRSIEPQVFEALDLGETFAEQRMLIGYSRMMKFLAITINESRVLLGGRRAALGVIARIAFQYITNWRARLRGMGNTRLTLGRALTARLRYSLKDRGVPLWLETPLRELIVEHGRVVGALVEREGRSLRIRAERGILVASGGFERNAALRREHQPQPIGADWTVGSESNVGDAIAIGQKVGASFDLMDEAWWTPVFLPPTMDRPTPIIFEKGLPGSVIVNKSGRRFMNEASPYNEVVKQMYAAHEEASSIPAYFVFDAGYRKRHPCGPVRPGYSQPDWSLAPVLRDTFLSRSKTLLKLANKLGLDAEQFVAAVERFNEQARRGVDEDFGRGESSNDRYYGDPSIKPNPCLAPLDTPPFYAVEVYPGDLGTKGGLRADNDARVLTSSNEPIPGLYAAGNCSASVMGRTYPGAGATIAPAMTFGYLAALHATEPA
ncbi:MAG: FAD-binding protein [Deltaproteobacteria bacterium]|nr:FAD-binding protein [Deltaproteobacteria bacterium]MBW2359612.1 FAD-binding protein [Deltaproteobacteria bacterium]